MADVIKLDTEIDEMANFRYQTLINAFGKEEADRIIKGDDLVDAEEVDDELKDIMDFGAEALTE